MAKEKKEKRTAKAKESGAEISLQPEEASEGLETTSEGKKVELTDKEYAELKKRAKESDEYLNMLLRTKADFQNYQKRMKKDIDALNRLAVQDVMHAILPVLDNLSRAVSSVRKSDDTQSLEKFLHGVELIQDQFLKALDAIGVKPIHGQEGQAFNPELHEAVMEEENDEFPHHTVLEEVEQGFFLHDKVLRPVKVRVSKKTVAGTEKGKAECTVEGAEDRSTKEAGRGPDSSPKSPSEGSREGVDTDPTAGEEEPIV